MMMSHPSLRSVVSVKRMSAVARVRLRRIVRTRILFVALLLALLPWALVESTSLVARLSALATFTVAGLTALAAGAVADDLDSGEYAIIMTHDTSPLDVLGGQAAATLGLTALLVALQLPLVLHQAALPHVVPLLLCIGSLAALLAGWLALMLFLATFLEGKANAVTMIAVLFVPLALGTGVLDRIPRIPATLIRSALQLLPQVDQVTPMFRSFLYRTPMPTLAPFALIGLPIFYFALASIRLNRIQPAGRLTQ